MKILLISHIGAPRIDLMADSALVTSGRPWFMPDIPDAASWLAQPLLAVRICRLGKGMPRKFAHRYYDGITLGIRLIPLDSAGADLTHTSLYMDFAVAIGQWLPVPPDPMWNIRFTDMHIEIPSPCPDIDQTIAHIAQSATVKMGDILLLPIPLNPLPAAIGTSFPASIQGEPILISPLK